MNSLSLINLKAYYLVTVSFLIFVGTSCRDNDEDIEATHHLKEEIMMYFQSQGYEIINTSDGFETKNINENDIEEVVEIAGKYGIQQSNFANFFKNLSNARTQRIAYHFYWHGECNFSVIACSDESGSMDCAYVAFNVTAC